MENYLSKEEISTWRQPAGGFAGADKREPLRAALSQCGQFNGFQTAGRFYPIACVALEVTQRCNLDCTLCYLSDHAEMAHDVPLEVLCRRVDMIERHYGPKTSVQITGGDPTLRTPEDLEVLCRHIRQGGMRSCLMTNGIRATKDLLERLAAAGLDDVAFHVDLTQERPGFPTEVSLNSIRQDYICRARSVGLRVLFNTTIFDGNLAEVPAIARFMRQNAHQLALVSFQMQAETGRGRIHARSEDLTTNAVGKLLGHGMGAKIGFNVASVGHASCTQYDVLLVAGNRAVSALGNAALFKDLLAKMERTEVRTGATTDIRATLRRLLPRHPILTVRLAVYLMSRLWRLRNGIWSSRGRVHRLSIMIHNFMDAKKLEKDRCESCVFMVATEKGPVSMCVHNARRDANIFAPVAIDTKEGPAWWSARTGRRTAFPSSEIPNEMPFKKLKGHLRERAKAKRADKVLKR